MSSRKHEIQSKLHKICPNLPFCCFLVGALPVNERAVLVFKAEKWDRACAAEARCFDRSVDTKIELRAENAIYYRQKSDYPPIKEFKLQPIKQGIFLYKKVSHNKLSFTRKITTSFDHDDDDFQLHHHAC